MAKRIIITGPESSGKSTLFQYLKRELNLEGVGEYAREYLEEKGINYSFKDLELIAKKQLSLCQSMEMKHDFIFLCDTNALVLKIWVEEKFQKTIEVVEKELRKDSDDLYLLCKPDLPWKDDPLRENPLDRDRLFQKYLRYLEEYDLEYEIISGNGEERNYRALSFIKYKGRNI